MTAIASGQEYLDRLMSLPRPGEDKIFAFYEHRIGMICKDPKLLLIPMDDHMVHRGDGIFETVKFINRRIYQLDAHLERMEKNCRTVAIEPPVPFSRIRELVLDVARAADRDEGYLSFFIGRGPGGFSIDFRESPEASLYLVARRYSPPSAEFVEKGVTAHKSDRPAKQGYMAKIKSVNYLPNVLMKKEAVEKGYNYAICFDENGCLAEGCVENVVIVNQEGKILIPDLTNALTGTTLMRALDLIKNEVSFIFRAIHEEEIYQAREVILLSTTLDALSIVRYNDKPIHDVRPGPVSRRLRELLIKDMQENGVKI
ncbi:aminotransferase class IV [Desulfonatronovibrio hydrogenovorans]|uniref:aminotransferase class IV n=1 Tax=Desulfonatronovibrio hydrogenovorans TaxID=53245 RepID=UPI00048D3F39|nr:aminotransferase class IV [Desulfonatronovibrio hydrogenovorans]